MDARAEFEIIIVSDGSTDGSPFTLVGVPRDHCAAMEFEPTRARGMRCGRDWGGRGRYLGFIDADGDISPEFLARS